MFDIIVECPPVQELIKGGYLVGTKVYAPTKPDLAGVRVKLGDYVEKQLAVAEQIKAALKSKDVKTMQQAKQLHGECGEQLAMIDDEIPF